MATPNDKTKVANVQWVEISTEWHSFANFYPVASYPAATPTP